MHRRESSSARVALVLIHEHRALREALAGLLCKHPEYRLLAALADVGEAGRSVRTINEVVAGKGVLAPALTASLFAEIRGRRAGSEYPAPAPPQRGTLSVRERQVTACVERGMSNKAIGVELGITTDTVKTHMHSSLKKLGLRSRNELPATALSASG